MKLEKGISCYPNILNYTFLVLSGIQMEPHDESQKGRGDNGFQVGKTCKNTRALTVSLRVKRKKMFKQKNFKCNLIHYQNHKHCNKICQELHMINQMLFLNCLSFYVNMCFFSPLGLLVVSKRYFLMLPKNTHHFAPKCHVLSPNFFAT